MYQVRFSPVYGVRVTKHKKQYTVSVLRTADNREGNWIQYVGTAKDWAWAEGLDPIGVNARFVQTESS